MLSLRPRLSKLSDLELLSRLKDFHYLSLQQITELHDRMSTRIFNRKDLIYREESRRRLKTYLLLLGTAQLSYVNSHTSRAVAIVPTGLILKCPLIPNDVGHRFELRALNECRVASLPTTDFMNIVVRAHPDLYTRLSESENERMGRLMARYPGFVGLGVLPRTVVALMELVTDFGVRDDGGMLLRISPTHQQLADLVGASRSKVTRMLGELERRGIIARRGRQIALRLTEARALLVAEEPSNNVPPANRNRTN